MTSLPMGSSSYVTTLLKKTEKLMLGQPITTWPPHQVQASLKLEGNTRAILQKFDSGSVYALRQPRDNHKPVTH